jgi:hypothetical protein
MIPFGSPFAVTPSSSRQSLRILTCNSRYTFVPMFRLRARDIFCSTLAMSASKHFHDKPVRSVINSLSTPFLVQQRFARSQHKMLQQEFSKDTERVQRLQHLAESLY